MAQPQKLRVKKVGDYILINQIGKGSFGSVWLSQYANRKDNTQFAIKEMKNEEGPSNQMKNTLRRREINNMYRVNHKNLIELKEIFSTANNCYLVMEYAEGGTLKEYLQRRGGKISELEALYFMQQLAEGLKVLYDNKILHRDLKPENLLLDKMSTHPILKICDLGLSKSIEDDGAAKTKCGTRHYMAYEILKGESDYNYKVDLWSTGVILYEMLAGKKPFAGQGEYQLMANQLLGVQLEAIQNCSEGCKDFVKKLLTADPEKRINFEEFYNNPWLRSIKQLEIPQQAYMQSVKVDQVEPSFIISDQQAQQITNALQLMEKAQNIEGVQNSHIKATTYAMAAFILNKIKNDFARYDKDPKIKNLLKNVDEYQEKCGYDLALCRQQFLNEQQNFVDQTNRISQQFKNEFQGIQITNLQIPAQELAKDLADKSMTFLKPSKLTEKWVEQDP